MKKYQLTINSQYCAHWGIQEALRELFQNQRDFQGDGETYYIKDPLTGVTTLDIISKNTTLSAKDLIMGTTTKLKDNWSVGGFGEGFKIALLVLLRCGLDVEINNGSKVWTPKLEDSQDFEGVKLLQIYEKSGNNHNKDLVFSVLGLNQEEVDEAIDRNIHLQDPDTIGEVIQTTMGNILTSRKGKLFVGGLFVKNTNLDYSYDFHPEFLILNRDRQSVDGWDLGKATGNIWNLAKKPCKVAEMVLEDKQDVSLIRYTSTSEELHKACYKLHKKEHGDVRIVNSEKEKTKLKNEGYNSVIVHSNDNFVNMVHQSSDYREKKPDEVVKDPLKMLEDLIIQSEKEEVTKDDVLAYLKDLSYTYKNKGVVWQ